MSAKLREKFFRQLLGVGELILRHGQFRDFQSRLALPFDRRVRRQIFLIRGHRLGCAAHSFQRLRAHRHAFGDQTAVVFKPRDLEQVRRRRERRVEIARRESGFGKANTRAASPVPA